MDLNINPEMVPIQSVHSILTIGATTPLSAQHDNASECRPLPLTPRGWSLQAGNSLTGCFGCEHAQDAGATRLGRGFECGRASYLVYMTFGTQVRMAELNALWLLGERRENFRT